MIVYAETEILGVEMRGDCGKKCYEYDAKTIKTAITTFIQKILYSKMNVISNIKTS